MTSKLYVLGGLLMKKLRDLSDLTSVTNPNHREILQALRDLDLSVSEIAKHLNVGKRLIYYVASKYLVKGFINERARHLEKPCLTSDSRDDQANAENDDFVIIVPEIDPHPPLTQKNLPTGVGLSASYDANSHCEQRKRDINYGSTLTIDSKNFKLQWTGASPEYANEICMLLNVLQSKF